ncbi:MAG: RHS repeat-associated core domain-containing protein [Bacillota bacterium]|nr:RHS repeat-associated core domain-containing protein [Bacillota bacterium]
MGVSLHKKTYTYDAWGKLLSFKDANGNTITDTTSVALINPIRYRGYVYDTESGLYYLQSRYYDPTTCRFVNADNVCDTKTGLIGTNEFAYCNNNSVNLVDKRGNAPSSFYQHNVNNNQTSTELGIYTSGSCYVICYVDNNIGKTTYGFKNQAKNSGYYDSTKATIVYIRTLQEFINAWNNMPSRVNNVFIFAHGSKTNNTYSELDFAYAKSPYYQALSDTKQLKWKLITTYLFIIACDAGSFAGNSIASKFAKAFKCRVVACDGGVSFDYSSYLNKYYARMSNNPQLGGYGWNIFYYDISTGQSYATNFAWEAPYYSDNRSEND